MKTRIFEFNQDVAISYGLDMNDILLLHWFVNNLNTSKIKMKLIQQKPYYWVFYEFVITELPILKISSRIVLRRRFKKLCDCHVLHFFLEKNENGTHTYYTLGENFSNLVS